MSITYEEYVRQVREHFSKLKPSLTAQELNNYFSETETIEELKGSYKAFLETDRIGHPASVASNLELEY